MAESKPIDCATAEQDIATLEKEKANVADQVAAGARIALPPAAIIDIFYGYNQDKQEADEFFEDKNDVASGDYNERIDKKIAAIKEACGL